MDLETLEPGQRVRWRGRRWRVDHLDDAGFLSLVGLDPINRDQKVTPLLSLEREAIEPDVLPLPTLDFRKSDRAYWRAIHQSFLVTMADGREQLVGLDWGAIAVEPYQLVPLMRVAQTVRPRLLIADDTGLGKTAEGGIILRWLARRYQAGRVLVVTRATPEPKRWRNELWVKFGFQFDILKNGSDFAERRRQAPTVNVFAQQNHLLASMTLLARQALLDELRKCPAPFDAVIVDEAHHLAERGKRTKRLSQLGKALAKMTANGTLLLLTATPHDGKTESFLSLLRLLDPLVDLAEGRVPVDVASRLVVRRLKREVTLTGGRKFLEPNIRVISTLADATPAEKAIDAPLDEYLSWLAKEGARYQGQGARAKAQGCEFLAGVLRKRLGSSVAALRATLRRRLGLAPADEDQDETVPYVEDDASDPEDEIIDPSAGAETPPPDLTPQEAVLARGVLAAADTVKPGRDAKLEALVRLLRKDVRGQKVVIFTEYRDTLRAARRRLDAEKIHYVVYHGGSSEAERKEAERAFLHDEQVSVFLATDAASEGKNLQRSAHHLVHLDVPWNPNRYAQRNGRIDRYGQGHRPEILVLVAADRKRGQGRPESRALELVVEKLRTIQDELGSVGPVLPGFSSGTVGDVLRAGASDAEERVEEALDSPEAKRAGEDLSRLSLRNRRDIEDAEGYVERFGTTDDFEKDIGTLVRTAFRAWDDGGALDPVDGGSSVFRVKVPARLRPVVGTSVIERATFRREVAVAQQDSDDGDAPEFLSPAHPLVEQVLRLLRDEAGSPDCPHRFDVEVSEREGLVLAFVVRFVDGDGRTVDERLEPVEISLARQVSTSSDEDRARLGIHAPNRPERPDAAAISRWVEAFPSLVAPARTEAERRAQAQCTLLVEAADRLREEELEVLVLWRAEQAERIELVAFGRSAQTSFEGAAQYEAQMRRLREEYDARCQALRDRSHIRLGSIDLVGGRLLVKGTK